MLYPEGMRGVFRAGLAKEAPAGLQKNHVGITTGFTAISYVIEWRTLRSCRPPALSPNTRKSIFRRSTPRSMAGRHDVVDLRLSALQWPVGIADIQPPRRS